MNTAAIDIQPRKVGVLLAVGIFLLPFVFAWFLLRKGHSQLARVVGFGWLLVLAWVIAMTPPATPAVEATAAPAIATTPAITLASAESGAAERVAALIESSSEIHEAEELPALGPLPALKITHHKKAAWNEKQWLESSSLAVDSILKTVSKKYADKYSRVDLEFTMPVVDKYGNQTQERGMLLAFDMADLRKVNWSNSSPWLLLNLSKPEFSALGRTAFDAYCADEKNAKWADTFCRVGR